MIRPGNCIALAFVVAFGLTIGSASAQPARDASVRSAAGGSAWRYEPHQTRSQFAPVPNISGLYRITGYTTEVRQRGGQLLFINEWGSVSRGVFISPTVVRALDWDDGLIGVLNRNRIEWANGTVWFKR